MTDQTQLDGRVSATGKLDSRYWYYFRQGGETYGVYYDALNLGFKPVNFNYERALQKRAAELAKSVKPSLRFTLPAFVESFDSDGGLVRVTLLLPGPLNQTITTRFYPDRKLGADVGFAVGAVMEKLDVRRKRKSE
ncbi:MAG: hypothetical protein KGH79_02015 [Patescibacteria group bacterium]|nr:hypothetical protein [Patescibacteria group bacterium]